MRTLGQLSAVTGIPRRTLKYWSDEPGAGARKNQGAGLLAFEIDPSNGYRLFDDDALIKVLFIQMAQEAGFTTGAIRRATSGNVEEEIAGHIDWLQEKQRELERQLRLTRAIQAVVQEFANPDNPDKGETAAALIESELLCRYCYELGNKVAEGLPPDELRVLQEALVTNENEDSRGYIAALAEYGQRTTAGEIDDETRAAARQLSERTNAIGNTTSEEAELAFDEFVQLFRRKAKPQSKEVLRCLGRLVPLAFPAVEKLPRHLQTKALTSLFSPRFAAALSELVIGQGFASFAQAALESYCAHREEADTPSR